MYNQEGNFYKTTVVAQKIIDNQNSYLVTKRGESNWVKLVDANERTIKAIINFERQRYHASQQAPYNPLTDQLERQLDREEQQQVRNQSKINILGNSTYRTKLRSNQLTPITKVEFYSKGQNERKGPKVKNIGVQKKLTKQSQRVINLEESQRKATLKKEQRVQIRNLKLEQKFSKIEQKRKKLMKNEESFDQQEEIQQVKYPFENMPKIEQKGKNLQFSVNLKLSVQPEESEFIPQIAP